MVEQITMNVDETLELDYLVEQIIDDEANITTQPSNVSTSIDYIKKQSAIFNPPDTGTYKIDINSQTIEIEVTDIPDSVVDQFEKQQYEDKNNTLSDYYNGDLGYYNRQQSTFLQGSYSLEANSADDSNTYITSLSGLNAYPSAGDTFQFLHKTGGGDSFSFMGFGIQDDSAIDDNGYEVMVSNAYNEFRIVADKTNLVTKQVTINDYEQYRVEVDWGSNGTITAKLFDSTDTKQSEISASDSSHTSGGIRWSTKRIGPETAHFDGYQIL